MGQIKVGLLFGGYSGEHEVSIISAQAIASAFTEEENPQKYQIIPFYIDKKGNWHDSKIAQQVLNSGQSIDPDHTQRWNFPSQLADIDVFFPILHGPNGEDGTIQGLFKLMQVPHVGSSVLGSCVGMDKIAMKAAFKDAGLPQVDYVAVSRSQVWSSPCSDGHSLAPGGDAGSHLFPKLCDDLEAAIDYPCFVKPANLGSSVGIAKVRSRQELEAALDNAAGYDRRIVVEAGVVAREVECAVLGNENPQVSVVGEISFTSDFYDYETKYTEGRSQLHIPAQLPQEIVEQIQTMAIEAFQAVDASGLSRVDFFYVEATGEIFLNEINTLPGFTALSMYPQLWAASGIKFPELVDQLIGFAQERFQESEN